MSIQRAQADLRFLAEYAHDLADSRFPGTRRPWWQVDIPADRKAELEAEAIAERRDRAIRRCGRYPGCGGPSVCQTCRPAPGAEAPGYSPAPGHVDVADLMADLLSTVDELAERLAQALGMNRLAHATSVFADPRPYLRLLRVNLDHPDLEPALVAEVADAAARLSRDVAAALRLLRAGQVLDTACPWCLSLRSLRVTSADVGHGPEALIVCMSGVCEPPESDCGTWTRGRPAWRFPEWEWLSQRLTYEGTR